MTTSTCGWRLTLGVLLLLWTGARICSGDTPSYSLNDLLKRKGRLPLHGQVTPPSTVCYCYQAEERYSMAGVKMAWTKLNVTLSDYEHLVIAVGNSTEAVHDALLTTPPHRGKTFSRYLPPYQNLCVGLGAESAAGSYTLDAQLRVALYLPVMMVVGLALYFSAHSLSRSVSLYYGGGMVLGIVASVLILLYIFSRFVPKKNIIGLGIFAGGWAVFAAAIYWFLDHLQDMLLDYWHYLLVYVCVAAVVSFAVLYRMGPISNPRTYDLLQWAIQLIGLGLVYYSTQMWELSLVICVLVLTLYSLPPWCNPLFWPFLILYYTLYVMFYPLIVCLRCLNVMHWFSSTPRRRLLTQEEYEEQGRVETKRALQELRQHCQQLPTREVVGVMSRLRNTNRFSNFLNGSDHVSAEEQVAHDWLHAQESDTSDEDDYSDNERGSSSISSSMDSSRYSHDSPVRPHPSPPRSPAVGQRSPHRVHTSSRVPSRYHTTY